MLVDQIRSIDVDYVVGDPVDYLTWNQLAEVELALAHYLGVQDVSAPRSS
jgi:mRNA interferase MazF